MTPRGAPGRSGSPGEPGSAFARHATPISATEFKALRDLIHARAGINLIEHKKALLTGRLQVRLRQLGLDSYDEYLARVLKDPAEMTEMLDRISTNETHFFREPRQFEFLERGVLPEWRARAERGERPRRVSVWSAACSTGEEPYSLAMTLLANCPVEDGWTHEILASDISTRVLARAEAALWKIEKSAEIPPAHLKAFMLRGVGAQEGLMKAGPELRELVRFARVNLIDDAPALPGRYDLIFCRNVLIYFDLPTKAKVVNTLLDHLNPGGLLFLGHAESLHGLTERASSVGPTVYARVGDTAIPVREARRARSHPRPSPPQHLSRAAT